jgi:hypothetical protein
VQKDEDLRCVIAAFEALRAYSGAESLKTMGVRHEIDKAWERLANAAQEEMRAGSSAPAGMTTGFRAAEVEEAKQIDSNFLALVSALVGPVDEEDSAGWRKVQTAVEAQSAQVKIAGWKRNTHREHRPRELELGETFPMVCRHIFILKSFTARSVPAVAKSLL